MTLYHHENKAFISISDEIDFADVHRKKFIETLQSFSEDDFTHIQITRADIGQTRNLGDFLLRVAYHESVHAGQLLSYLRTLNIDRPKLWD
jgi:uncharacterized damage-inducible protein DinB